MKQLRLALMCFSIKWKLFISIKLSLLQIYLLHLDLFLNKLFKREIAKYDIVPVIFHLSSPEWKWTLAA